VKAGFVTGLSSPVGLIETLRVENGHPLLLALHLDRMQSSAKALGIAFNRPLVERKVEGLLKESLHTPQGDKPEGLSLLRLELPPDGDLQIRQQRIDPVTGPQKIFWAKDLIGEQVAIMKSSYRLLSHKVTARAQYDAAWRAAVARGGFDALFTNERGEVTEGGRSSIFVFVNGAWITPPLRCGVPPC
jgi:para-aminobenzoate synthetase / 4-amino-4-deoxychorismate lyase